MKNKTLVLKPKDRDLLKKVYDFAKIKKKELYLVGGYLRDIFLNREKDNPDIDFCLKQGAIEFGRALSKRLSAGFVVLDKQHGCCRVVKNAGDRLYTLDFSDFRSKDLEGDLLHRDFTINSLAMKLEDTVRSKDISGSFIDYYGGKADLKAKAIKVINKGSFDEDPLRVLRAFSLAGIFGFKIDKQALKLIISKKGKLASVSYERIRDELFKILETGNAFDSLSRMDKLGILRLVIPEIEVMRGVAQGPYHHLDVLQHSLETLRQLEIAIEEYRNDKDIRAYLNTVISGQRKRLGLIKLGALLHDIGKPQTLRHKNGKTIFHGHERAGSDIMKLAGKRLRLSNDELDALKKMIFWHLRPGYMADNKLLTLRAKFRYFRDTAVECISVLLISLADQRATRGPLTSRESRQRHERVVSGLIKEYFKKQKEKKLPRLINGDDLIGRFKLKPGPVIGKILAEIEEMQATGKIKTRRQALQSAESIKDKLNRNGNF